MAAFDRRRVELALITYLGSGTSADIAVVARAWYCTLVPLRYLRERYRHTALRRFVAEDELDVRCCIMPELALDLEPTPRRHRVEIRVRSGA